MGEGQGAGEEGREIGRSTSSRLVWLGKDQREIGLESQRDTLRARKYAVHGHTLGMKDGITRHSPRQRYRARDPSSFGRC